MTNILITGSNGFIGRNLSKQLKIYPNYSVTELNRNNCNLLDPESIKRFFQQQNKSYDLVIHTAVEGGRRNKPDGIEIVHNNLLMLYNLLSQQQYYQCIISFGSGAELDRRYHINGKDINRYPVDPYGLSKNLIYKLSMIEPKLCNFRIFNCFGIDEPNERMIRSSINKYLNKQNITIHQNKKVDFFYIDDLVATILYFIEQNNIPKHHDCCYMEKYTLLDIANMINNLDTHKVDIVVSDDIHINPINSMPKDYIGMSIQTNINLFGIKKALQIVYDYYKNTTITPTTGCNNYLLATPERKHNI